MNGTARFLVFSMTLNKHKYITEKTTTAAAAASRYFAKHFIGNIQKMAT